MPDITGHYRVIRLKSIALLGQVIKTGVSGRILFAIRRINRPIGFVS
jgi:hypothetical protein